MAMEDTGRAGLRLNADFMKLWTGRTISEFGSRITREGIPLTALLVLGAGPAQMGVLSAVGSAPVLLVGLLAGAWVDRIRRRPVLIGVDLARAALLATIPIAAALGVLHVGQLYVVIAIAGALAVIFEIADQAYLPSLVERAHLMEGNSRLGASASLAEIGGPALAGTLVQLLTAPIAIALDALSFLASAVSVALIRKPEPPPEPQDALTARALRAEIGEGLRLVWDDRRLRALMLATASRTFFGYFYAALYSLYAVRDLALTPAVLGVIISMGGVGALAGTVLAGPVSRRYGIGRTLVGCLAISTLLGFLTPLAPGPAPVAALFLAVPQLFGDCAMVIFAITEVSLRQTITPDRLLGRMNASIRFVVGGLSPLGALLGGLLATWLGARYTLLIAVLGGALAVAWVYWSPLRKLRHLPSGIVVERPPLR